MAKYQCPFNSITEASEALEEAMLQGVAKRLQGQVPVGLYLSGGLDSAVVGKFAYDAGQSVSKQIQSFSHGFDGKTDEIPSARKVAKALGVELEEVPLDDSLMLELPKVVRAVESPVANSDILGLWALARHASRSVRVVLCGEGADEIFLNDGGIDHNYSLINKNQDRPLAVIYSNKTGMGAEYLTNQPGIQFYTGNMMSEKYNGKYNRNYGVQYGMCLETQNFPDAINHSNFPSPILKKGDIYKSLTKIRLRNDFF